MPVGLVIFFGLFALVVFGGLFTDRALALPPLLPGRLGAAVGGGLLAAGLVAWLWCVDLFAKAKGTPVPFDPPRELVVTGPYAWVRNPMQAGVFAVLFGLGFALHSLSVVLLWTPLFLALSVLSIERIEEPELERRFGDSYRRYRDRVPRLVPRRPRASPGD
jgi:protein-S-isoprenylcysteine O-methyltransferase Ste14